MELNQPTRNTAEPRYWSRDGGGTDAGGPWTAWWTDWTYKERFDWFCWNLWRLSSYCRCPGDCRSLPSWCRFCWKPRCRPWLGSGRAWSRTRSGWSADLYPPERSKVCDQSHTSGSTVDCQRLRLICHRWWRRNLRRRRATTPDNLSRLFWCLKKLE